MRPIVRIGKKEKNRFVLFYTSTLMLYIMRHGEAEKRNSGGSDEERALTERGRKEVLTTIQTLSRLGGRVDLVLCSPLVRARQSAEIACEVLSLRIEPLVEETLEPSATPYEFYSILAQRFRANHSSLLAVSHQPLVSSLISGLLGVEDSRVSMPTSAVAGIYLQDAPGSTKSSSSTFFGAGRLALLIPPPSEGSM